MLHEASKYIFYALIPIKNCIAWCHFPQNCPNIDQCVEHSRRNEGRDFLVFLGSFIAYQVNADAAAGTAVGAAAAAGAAVGAGAAMCSHGLQLSLLLCL